MILGRLHPHPANFRKDINGLRAWAVVAVVLFHFGIPGFRVVLSGLMCSSSFLVF